MESTISSATSVTEVKSARCVLFAYHEMGYACMEALLKMGAPITALVTHRDDPHEEIWWRSCAELAARSGIAVHTPGSADAELATIVGDARPAVIYSFYYRYLIPESVLGLAHLGAFNLHGSLLPAYRGRAPVNWMRSSNTGDSGGNRITALQIDVGVSQPNRCGDAWLNGRSNTTSASSQVVGPRRRR